MATHNFGPVYHSESPTSMNMFGHVDDNGNYRGSSSYTIEIKRK